MKVLENQEFIQLINTAIIKNKEKHIDASYEERLASICNTPAMKALSIAIAHLSDQEKISRDQAAIQIIETVRQLEGIWNDYIMMEGINNLKEMLKSH